VDEDIHLAFPSTQIPLQALVSGVILVTVAGLYAWTLGVWGCSDYYSHLARMRRRAAIWRLVSVLQQTFRSWKRAWTL
jgi:hypothetical protein